MSDTPFCIVCGALDNLGRCPTTGQVFCLEKDCRQRHIDAPRGRRFRGLTKFNDHLPAIFDGLFAYADRSAELMSYTMSKNHEGMKSWSEALAKQARVAREINNDIERLEKSLSVLDAPGLANSVEDGMRRIAWAIITYIEDITSPTPSFIETVTDDVSQDFINRLWKAIEADTTSPEVVEILGLWSQPSEEGLRFAVQAYARGITADQPWSDRTGWRQRHIKAAKRMGELLDAAYKNTRDDARAARKEM